MVAEERVTEGQGDGKQSKELKWYEGGRCSRYLCTKKYGLWGRGFIRKGQ